MDWSAGAAALLYGAASNLDTLILALSWGGRGGRRSPGQWGVIAGVTTGVTWCALSLGGAAAALTAAGRMLGAVVLVGLGLWTLLDWLRRLDPPEAAPPPPSGLRGCLPLAAALAVNNGGMGLAAGAAGLSPLWAAAVNLAVTLLSLATGCALGRRAAGTGRHRWALPLSGALLVVLGAMELL